MNFRRIGGTQTTAGNESDHLDRKFPSQMSFLHLFALAGLLTDVAEVRTIPLSFPYHAQNQQLCKALLNRFRQCERNQDKTGNSRTCGLSLRLRTKNLISNRSSGQGAAELGVQSFPTTSQGFPETCLKKVQDGLGRWLHLAANGFWWSLNLQTCDISFSQSPKKTHSEFKTNSFQGKMYNYSHQKDRRGFSTWRSGVNIICVWINTY